MSVTFNCQVGFGLILFLYHIKMFNWLVEESKVETPARVVDNRTIKEIYQEEYNERLEQYIKSESFSYTITDWLWVEIKTRLEMANDEWTHLKIKFCFMWKDMRIKFRRNWQYSMSEDMRWEVILFWKITSVYEYWLTDRTLFWWLIEWFRERVERLKKSEEIKKRLREVERRKAEDDEYLEKLRELRGLKPLDNDLKETFDRATEIESDTKKLLIMTKALEQKRKEFYN